jgi:DNA primase
MNPIEIIKDRLSILDVVSTYLSVEKSGSQFKARCPFHNEKTPSFYISPEQNFFHCFGCQKSGDIFKFVEEIEHIPFREALVLLAGRAHVELQSFKKNDEEASFFEILDEAVSFYVGTLRKSPEALLYIKERGLFDETIESAKIGFAPLEWSSLTNHLKQKGFKEDDLVEVGLSIKTEKGVYDRFRGRVMFPIFTGSGKVCGFTGRILPSVEKASPKPLAKYVNSPETPIYHKSKILFGLHTAKKYMVERNECIVVEGQMDVLMSQQSGALNTIAVSGTAFTEDQVLQIKRFTKNISLCFDTDEAGKNALKRSALLALLAEMEVFVITPGEDYKDAAELIVHDSSLWHEAIKNKKSVVEYFLDLHKNLERREFLKAVTRDVFPLLVSFSNKVDASYYTRLVSEALGIEMEAIQSELKKINLGDISHTAKKFEEKEENFLPQKKRLEKIYEELFSLITLEKTHYEQNLERLKKVFEDNPHCGPLYEIPEQVLAALLFKTEERSAGKDLNSDIENLFRELKREVLSTEIENLKNTIKETGDESLELTTLLAHKKKELQSV